MEIAPRHRFVWLALLMAFALPLLCSPASMATRPHRMVFAHYMLANQDYEPNDPTGERNITSYEREIRQAQSIGIDGFALNAGGWFKEPRYIRRASQMFEAAYRLHSNFKLMLSADMCCSNDATDVEDMVRRFANHPRYSAIYYKHNGRFVLTTFSGSSHGPAFWQQLRDDLEKGTHPSQQAAPGALSTASGISSSAPLCLELIPAFFWGGELPTAANIQAGLDDYTSIIDGAFYWGIAGVPGLGHAPDQLPSSEAYASVLHTAGKIYMAPICFQFWGANAGRYYEYSGYSGMRAMWINAIRVTHPDWVEIITWNDFVEGTYVSPIDDPAKYAGANDLDAGAAPPSTLRFYHSHRGATELLAYFIQWYKTGHQPAIRNDTIYWAYRTQLAPDPTSATTIKQYGPVANVVYITANLTAPATLLVTFGSTTKAIDLPAGSTDVEAPILSGYAPHFVLTRGKAQLTQATGDDAVTTEQLAPNFYYSTGSAHD